MDSLTHIASGALIGEALLGKKLGKKAMLFGALAQSLPDIDVVASFWLNTTDDLLAHRGITHSILFAALASIVLAAVALKTHPKYNILLWQWILFFAIEIFTHLFLDAFNNYGTGWFEPFNHQRISFNTLFVLDPFYSITLIVVFIALLILSRSNLRRKVWALSGLIISTLYLCYALYHKYSIDIIVRKNLADQHNDSHQYFTTPTSFNNWLWYIVVKDSSGFSIGYHSVLDPNTTIAFQHFQKNEVLLEHLKDQRIVQQLIKFSQNNFTVENHNDTLVFNDLRFGQIAGWTNATAPFVFHYYVNHPEANALIVQRGRFEGWNKKTISDFVRKIEGIKRNSQTTKWPSDQVTN